MRAIATGSFQCSMLHTFCKILWHAGMTLHGPVADPQQAPSVQMMPVLAMQSWTSYTCNLAAYPAYRT